MSKQIPCVNPLAKDPEYINWEEVQKLINIGDHLKFTANLYSPQTCRPTKSPVNFTIKRATTCSK